MAEQKSPKASKALVSLVGVTAAAILTFIVPQFEGTVNKGYFDAVGIPTKCSGDTENVVIGKIYSDAECRESLNKQLVKKAEGVLKCTPVLKDKIFQLVAAVDFAYNVGLGNYCGSATARRFNAGDFKGACRAMNESDSGKPQWVYANGKILPGLVKRRKQDRQLCEVGI